MINKLASKRNLKSFFTKKVKKFLSFSFLSNPFSWSLVGQPSLWRAFKRVLGMEKAILIQSTSGELSPNHDVLEPSLPVAVIQLFIRIPLAPDQLAVRVIADQRQRLEKKVMISYQGNVSVKNFYNVNFIETGVVRKVRFKKKAL